MVEEATDDRALRAVKTLRRHDFAFVKRSNGTFTYAILAYRSLAPIEPKLEDATTAPLEEFMSFVVCDEGSTKTIRKRDWSTQVRLVARDAPRRKAPIVAEDADELDLPCIISFVPNGHTFRFA